MRRFDWNRDRAFAARLSDQQSADKAPIRRKFANVRSCLINFFEIQAVITIHREFPFLAFHSFVEFLFIASGMEHGSASFKTKCRLYPVSRSVDWGTKQEVNFVLVILAIIEAF